MKRYQEAQSDTPFKMPNLNTNKVVLEALLRLSKKHWNKFMSSENIYQTMRLELFPIGHNYDLVRRTSTTLLRQFSKSLS
jgi:hypothetical protein